MTTLAKCSFLLIFAAGCGVASERDEGSEEPAHSAMDVSAAEECALPFTYYADPLAEQRARDRLALLSPAAALSWAQARGTLSSAANLELLLPACENGDLTAGVRKLIDSEPEIFRIESSQWDWPVLTCMSQAGIWVTAQHTNLSGSLAFRLQKTEAGFVLDAVIGNYLPAVVPGLDEAIEACPPLTFDKARELAFDTKYPYRYFDWCVPLGDGTYGAGGADELALGSTWVEWHEVSPLGPVEISLRTGGTLTVAPENYTPELLQSDAACPDPFGTGVTVGFSLTFDPVKPNVVYTAPGLGCIVCATGE